MYMRIYILYQGDDLSKALGIWSPSHYLLSLRKAPKLCYMRLDHRHSQCVMPSGIFGSNNIHEVRRQASMGQKPQSSC